MTKRKDDERSLGKKIIAGLEASLAYESGQLANVKVTRAIVAPRRRGRTKYGSRARKRPK